MGKHLWGELVVAGIHRSEMKDSASPFAKMHLLMTQSMAFGHPNVSCSVVHYNITNGCLDLAGEIIVELHCIP